MKIAILLALMIIPNFALAGQEHGGGSISLFLDHVQELEVPPAVLERAVSDFEVGNRKMMINGIKATIVAPTDTSYSGESLGILLIDEDGELLHLKSEETKLIIPDEKID